MVFIVHNNGIPITRFDLVCGKNFAQLQPPTIASIIPNDCLHHSSSHAQAACCSTFALLRAFSVSPRCRHPRQHSLIIMIISIFNRPFDLAYYQ